MLDHLARVHLPHLPLGAAGLDLREVEDLVDEAGEPLGLLDDDGQVLGAGRDVELGVVVEDLGERADRGERRAELVRDVRDEVVLHLVELLEPLVRAPELRVRARELARLLLELPAVLHDLRGLVEDGHHLVHA